MTRTPGPPTPGTFFALTVAAAFGFGNVVVFYGLNAHLERIGIDPAWRGAVIAAEPLTALLLRPFLAALVQPARAAGVGLAALAGSALCLNLYRFALSTPALLALRLAHGLAFVFLVTAITTLLASIVTKETSGRAFGLFSLSSLIPYAILPPLAERLLPALGGETGLYAWTGLLAVPAFFLLRKAGRGVAPLLSPERAAPLRDGLSRLLAAVTDPPLRAILGAQCALFSAQTLVFFYMKSRAAMIPGLDPGLFFLVSTTCSIGVRLLLGGAYDKLPKAMTTSLGAGCFALVVAGLGFVDSPLGVGLLAGVYGALLGLCLPLLNALMFVRSKPEARTINVNAMLWAMDWGYVLGPLAGGAVLAAGFGFGTLFGLAGALALAAALLLAPRPVKADRAA